VDFFFKHHFFTKCAPFLLKIEKNFNIDDRREKGFQPMIFFITHLNTFGSKALLTLKIMDFENVFFTKAIHIYVIKGMNAQYT